LVSRNINLEDLHNTKVYKTVYIQIHSTKTGLEKGCFHIIGLKYKYRKPRFYIIHKLLITKFLLSGTA